VIRNRSIPEASVIPVLSYADPVAAAELLVAALDFRIRLRIGSHRIQLTRGDGALVVTDTGAVAAAGTPVGLSILLRVEDVDAVTGRAIESGFALVQLPTDQIYGERQATLRDPGGHTWTLSQSIADADPAAWGGELVDRS
jgi:uncharacterized glyoxalase superfamily protein PhnB